MRRLVARISDEYQRDGIAWLVVEHDEADTKGFFLFLHKSLDEPSEFDEWYETDELAFASALESWGVKRSDWSGA
jgi:hypothetical protein